MIKALLLIFEPAATWEHIQAARRSLSFILCVHLLPLLIITAFVEGYRLTHAPRAGQIKELQALSTGQAAVYETAQFVLLLGVVFIGAKLLKSLGETFHGRHSFTQSFATVAYGLSPLFLFRLLDGLKDVPAWASWGIGIVLSIAVLYHGVWRMMEPDPPHAFGLYLMSSLLLLFITGLARFVTAWYLQGKFHTVDAFVTSLAERLHLPL